MAAAERKKPSQFLHDLIVDYAAGLTFDADPDLANLHAPNPGGPMTTPANQQTNEEN
jgi:hypothetical protein